MSTGDDEDDSDRNSIYFSTIRSRHADFFKSSRLTLPIKNLKKNPVRYSAHTSTSTTDGSFPTLYINKLSFSRDFRSSYDRFLLRLPVLKQEFHNVSFQLNSGDCLVLMFTKESEMISLLEVIAGVSKKSKLIGDIFINGHRMTRDRLEKTIAYVKPITRPKYLTVRQFLIIQSQLNPPATQKYGGSQHLVNRLITDLSLVQVCDISCSRVNRSQWTRIQIAIHLIRDPYILLIPDILKDIDFHDQCFIIDYLRTWANKTNKIVILAHFPTSIDVLKMFSKTLLLASGRVIFLGTPKELPEYFENIGCPCPKFKNPCDYYVDLVTHDNLTSEASRESSIRISRLVNKWMLIGQIFEKGSIGKVLLDLPKPSIIAQIVAVVSYYVLNVWNDLTTRLLSLFGIFTLSTILSIYISDLSLILPDAFLNRNIFIDYVGMFFSNYSRIDKYEKCNRS
ncbi:unnamed protein product [Caenorhabditis angaria]|uniref:ABC transporter domain-containing protein n=1 Tax=Caenorhabditis angaria TaxID=860376 RepID=A0A9P1IBP0_9PELO|nr:unnamed protein product [Caenorhabditis angaria]